MRSKSEKAMTLSEISPPGPDDSAVLTRPQVREGDDVVRDIATRANDNEVAGQRRR